MLVKLLQKDQKKNVMLDNLEKVIKIIKENNVVIGLNNVMVIFVENQKKKTCTWLGPLIKIKRNCKCKWEKTTKGTKRRRCCCFKRKCKGKYCFHLQNYCKWVGKSISKHIKHGCIWKPFGKTGRRKWCCRISRKCFKTGKCEKSKKEHCKWFGGIIRRKYFIKCSMKKRKYGFRKICCRFLKHCIGKFCQSYKLKCAPGGPKKKKITKKN